MMSGKWQERVKAVEQRALFYHSAPISCPYKARLSQPWQPTSVWRLFPRQSHAVAFSQRCKQDVHVFALEKANTVAGQRVYLVTSYSELWHYYSSHRQSLMHCYEVIPEGAVCKLYFDLEFDVASNTHLDGTKMVAALIQHVCVKLEEVYGVQCTAKDVLNLDSSTAEKFSRHLIFQLHNCAFKDNKHTGSFIHHILKPALKYLHTGPENSPEVVDDVSEKPQSKRMKHNEEDEEDLSFLIVKGKDGQKQLFVDLGVYTKNRNFRLYKSSKLGKNAAFSVAVDNEFVPRSSRRTTEEECIFLASLITNVSFTSQRILTYDAPDGTSKQSPCSARHRDPHSSGELAGEHQTSPYKELDEFVLKLLHRDGVQGNIRRWTYFVSEQLLVYDVGKFRWCSNVGRFHKSNNIMIIVDLKEEVWYQRCHDPECRRQNYRSSSSPLPQEVCMSYMLKEDEDDQQFLMDELGNIELSCVSEKGQKTGRSDPLNQTEEEQEGWDDDAPCLEALHEVEKTMQEKEEVPDELMIQALAECEATLVS
ncbi:DNA-directed primase/polymerase protein [Silurus meridionalis]|uniref:DNA-directed primase/polymerase protein n=1 Tax=Silurus meridionalis TaxID=175797 RepID=A0A8T0A732_SILME|nr:DNA-directed primase/polymerase protein [Silurus meridionalis]KAF7686727.1 hypothetical protein HF521_015120 [Silurus meridionalis]KAI5087699.1 DNA-directed primase/polymerase protein [Silurus meridionalis]